MNDEKTALGKKILRLKREKGLNWNQVAERLGYSPVWTCAACLGQMSMTPETADKAAALFGLTTRRWRCCSRSALSWLAADRGADRSADLPLLRAGQVYGTTWKELIQEEFGDGIMSAIDFDMALERQPDQKGDRVKLTMSGKFLPYRRY